MSEKLKQMWLVNERDHHKDEKFSCYHILKGVIPQKCKCKKPSTFLRILLLVSANVLIEAIEAHVVPFDRDLLTFELVPVVLFDELFRFLGAEHLHAYHAVGISNVTKVILILPSQSMFLLSINYETIETIAY